MTKEQFNKAKELDCEQQLLDNLFYTVTSDSDYQKLSDFNKRAIGEAFKSLKAEIQLNFQKL